MMKKVKHEYLSRAIIHLFIVIITDPTDKNR